MRVKSHWQRLQNCKTDRYQASHVTRSNSHSYHRNLKKKRIVSVVHHEGWKPMRNRYQAVCESGWFLDGRAGGEGRKPMNIETIRSLLHRGNSLLRFLAASSARRPKLYFLNIFIFLVSFAPRIFFLLEYFLLLLNILLFFLFVTFYFIR